MTEDEVERVAKAIYDLSPTHSQDGVSDDLTWEQLQSIYPDSANGCRDLARAAISAMHSPQDGLQDIAQLRELSEKADHIEALQAEVARLRALVALEDQTDPAYAQDMRERGFNMDPSYFEHCLGATSYHPHKWGKHSATNAKVVSEVFERLKTTDPEAADVIAGFVFFDMIHKNWAHNMVQNMQESAALNPGDPK